MNIIHHKNGDINDNTIENLEMRTMIKDHQDIDEAMSALERHTQQVQEKANESQMCSRTIGTVEELRSFLDEAEAMGFRFDRENMMQGKSSFLGIHFEPEDGPYERHVKVKEAYAWLAKHHQPEVHSQQIEKTQRESYESTHRICD